MKQFLAFSLLIGMTIPSLNYSAEVKKPMPVQVQVINMAGEDGKNVVEVAVGSKDHTTLVAAVKAAGLVEVLSGPGPFTVFAPTDAAFAKLPKETIPNLLKPENKKTLVSILEHHTAAPKYDPNVLAKLKQLSVVAGSKLKIENKEGHLFVEDNEIKTAIVCKNGIIYIVDNVMISK